METSLAEYIPRELPHCPLNFKRVDRSRGVKWFDRLTGRQKIALRAVVIIVAYALASHYGACQDLPWQLEGGGLVE